MYFSSAFVGLLTVLLTGVAAQSNEVPPPACLQACMDKVGNCNLCTDSGNAKINSCISSTCGYRDVTYADAYYGSVCSNGGYQDYETSPHHFQQVPAASCKESSTSSSLPEATPKPEKRSTIFVA